MGKSIHKASRSPKRKRRVSWKKGGMFIGMALLFLLFPLALDWLYGAGALSWLPHSFGASEWFAFIGGYVPTSLFGIITLYQAYIIRMKDKEYERLTRRYRFRIKENCKVWQWCEKTGKLGDYLYPQYRQMYNDKKNIKTKDEYEKYYLLQYKIEDTLERGIQRIEVGKMEWFIADQNHISTNADNILAYYKKNGADYQVEVFWRFDDGDSGEMSRKKVAQHMENSSRRNSDYERSKLRIYTAITDNEDEVQDLVLDFYLQCGDNSLVVISWDERITTGIG